MGPISIQQAVELLQSGKLKEMQPEIKMHMKQSLTCRTIMTFFKVLREAINSFQENDSKRAMLFLSPVKRE